MTQQDTIFRSIPVATRILLIEFEIGSILCTSLQRGRAMDSESADSKASRLLKEFFNKHGQKELIPPTGSTASGVELAARNDDRSPTQRNMNLKA
jgi:hypothetical protein